MEENKNGIIYVQGSDGEMQKLGSCTEIVVNGIDEEKFTNESFKLDLPKTETKTINIEILDKSLMKALGLNVISKKRFKKLLMSFNIPRNDVEKLSRIPTILKFYEVYSAKDFYKEFPRKDFRKMSIKELREIYVREF